MTVLNQIYKCNVCGNIVEMVHTGVGTLVCCGQDMELKQEKTQDPEISVEKHVPVLEQKDGEIIVKVGEVPHPMEDAHYIEWIEIITQDDKTYRKFLKPGDKPEAIFNCLENIKTVREYCNLHGLWVKN